MLFADLVGHTSRSDGADPEDVRDVLREYYRAVKATIERFGGVVEKFIGDAVMAVFGSPVARGDDAERAVRAALAIPGIIEQLNETSPHPDLEIHLAVNTGEAVVTIEPGSPDGDLLVAGDVVNTASRLQGAAPPGRVLIGEETFRATRRVIRSEPVPAVAAKGKREPIPAWMAIEALVPLSVRPAEMTFVGRERESDLVRDIWSRAVAERRPHLVTILGEAGIGKTRLAEELSFDVKATGGQAFHVRELPYEQSSGYETFVQLVHEVAGIFGSDPNPVATAKLEASLDRLGLVDPALVQLLSVFARTPEAVARPVNARAPGVPSRNVRHDIGIRFFRSSCSVGLLFCWSANDEAYGQQQDADHGASGDKNEPIRASHLIVPLSLPQWTIPAPVQRQV